MERDRHKTSRPAEPLEGGSCLSNHVCPAWFGGRPHCLLTGEDWCLQGAGMVDEWSHFLCGGRMCKLIGDPQKLPGGPLWVLQRMRPPCLAPCLPPGPPQCWSVLTAVLTRPFCHWPLFDQPAPLGNSQGWAWAGGAAGLPSCTKGTGVPQKGLVVPVPPCTASPQHSQAKPGPPESVRSYLHQAQGKLLLVAL